MSVSHETNGDSLRRLRTRNRGTRLNYIARFISQLTEKCDPIFRLLKNHNPRVWDDECQKAFDRVKQYLSNPLVLSPPSPDRPLILYLTVFDHSMGCVLVKAVKGSAIADFLASGALEDYEPLNFDFPNEDLMYVAAVKEDTLRDHLWKLNFDGASNAVGNGIGAVLVSPNRDHYPFTCKLDSDCTNNIEEYEACIMGLRAAIEREIKLLEVYGDSVLLIYQPKGEWETRDPKLINYQKIVMGLIEEFDSITFNYLPREENHMADALATLASMIKVSKQEDVKPIQMSIYEAPTHCYNMDEEERDNHPWYHDILRYVRNREYPEQATENDKRTLRRLACDYVLDGEVLYKRRKDQVLLRCVDVIEAKKF
ncbi:RNA-directed DNA polymerase (Reverse transcriptase), Ribonuclease H [Gossypium australe]|uniref:RNA-directed DNA polymerase (Reverse transcriptase), Ribonuclease H n=1 Tax=Gossypium australe TaxID=47621 RepID=A0A5B6WDE2_9ROSI|nr:RNA-directed DNA polymerase (Reverse transcriptase), Ribonuclease H [Gossypium australe]